MRDPLPLPLDSKYHMYYSPKGKQRLSVATWENFADHGGHRFCKLDFVFLKGSKTCESYCPRAEEVDHAYRRNNLTDAYKFRYLVFINFPRRINNH